MPEFVLRAGTPRDVPAMHRLDLLCFEPPFQFDLSAMRRFALERGAFSVVAERGTQMCGFLIVSMWRRRRPGTLAYVATLDVHPQLRRQGLGRRLIAAAEHQALGRGAKAILLHVAAANAAALAFYEAAGYRPADNIADFYGPGLHAWLYRKE